MPLYLKYFEFLFLLLNQTCNFTMDIIFLTHVFKEMVLYNILDFQRLTPAQLTLVKAFLLGPVYFTHQCYVL